MKTSSYNLLPATTNGTAVENYDGSSTEFSGIPQKAAAYYTKAKNSQTVSWYFVEFIGVLQIEATLDKDNTTNNYFSVHTIGDGINPLTENDFINLKGNYTWIRATVTDFISGTINKVSLGY